MKQETVRIFILHIKNTKLENNKIIQRIAKSAVKIREMDILDYGNIICLWQAVEGMCLRQADSRESNI